MVCVCFEETEMEAEWENKQKSRFTMIFWINTPIREGLNLGRRSAKDTSEFDLHNLNEWNSKKALGCVYVCVCVRTRMYTSVQAHSMHERSNI